MSDFTGNIAQGLGAPKGGGCGIASLLPAVIGGVGKMAGAGLEAMNKPDPLAAEMAKIEASRTDPGFTDFGAGLENVPNSDRARVLSLRNSRKPVLFNPNLIR